MVKFYDQPQITRMRKIHIENIYIVVEYQTYFVQGLKTGKCEVYQAFVICFDLENYV
jgi:hypothetical protein